MTEAAFPADAAAAFEREKWEAERGFRERELALREREQQNKETELALTKEAHAPSRWRSPVIVAVLAAAAAAAGNAFVAYTNSVSETKLEAQKAEHARILAMVTMLKWSRVGGRVMPGLLERRKREAALWKTP
jgi:hypothetical protein